MGKPFQFCKHEWCGSRPAWGSKTGNKIILSISWRGKKYNYPRKLAFVGAPSPIVLLDCLVVVVFFALTDIWHQPVYHSCKSSPTDLNWMTILHNGWLTGLQDPSPVNLLLLLGVTCLPEITNNVCQHIIAGTWGKPGVCPWLTCIALKLGASLTPTLYI